jgi:hypothetical protein
MASFRRSILFDSPPSNEVPRRHDSAIVPGQWFLGFYAALALVRPQGKWAWGGFANFTIARPRD